MSTLAAKQVPAAKGVCVCMSPCRVAAQVSGLAKSQLLLCRPLSFTFLLGLEDWGKGYTDHLSLHFPTMQTPIAE